MKQGIVRRFAMYWQLELLNIFLLPLCALYVLIHFSQGWSWLFWAACIPMALLLLVGGLYWRAKWQQAQGRREPLQRLLPWAAVGKKPLLFLTLLSLGVWIMALFGLAPSAGVGELVASGAFVLLAAAEYINYYEVQLQHFDHKPDFVRFLAGKGFRKSHLKRDLERLAKKEDG